MQFGYVLAPQYDLSRDLSTIGQQLTSQVDLLNEAGFSSVSVGEHHVTDDFHYLNNETVAAHVASHAGDMWLDLTCILPYHNPVRIAEVTATLDVLTNGRVRLGIVRGYRDAEFEVFGVDERDAPGLMVEGIDIITRLWTEDRVSHAGEFYRFEDVGIRPQPMQRPRPTVWNGASNERSIRRNATISDMFIANHVPFDLARRHIGFFRDERESAGLPPGTVGLSRAAYVAETDEEAERIAKGPLSVKYGSYVEWGQDDAIDSDEFDAPWDRLRRDRFLVGSPETVVREIEQYRDAIDLDLFIVRNHFPTMAFDDLRRSIELFGDEVIPALS